MINLDYVATAPIAEIVEYLEKMSETLLPAKDLNFASDLCRSARKYKLNVSPKQEYWLRELAKRTVPQEERKTVDIGSLDGISALFDKAAAHLKRPIIVINDGEQDLRLSVAGSTAKVPGSIDVSTNRSFANRVWFGRILSNGKFEASPRVETPDSVVSVLRRFSSDPAGVAAEHGRATGGCCFCSRALNDARSVEVGYGPICAERWGLPWGEVSKAA